MASLFGTPRQSGPDQRLLSHRPQQERSRGRSPRRGGRQGQIGRRDWCRHHGGRHRGGQSAAADSGRRDRRGRSGPGRRRPPRAGRSVVRQKDQGVRRPAGDPLRSPAQRHDGRRRAGPGRPGRRGCGRESRREEGRLRPARAAVGQGCRAGLEHVDHSDHQAGPGPEAARSLCRHPLFQPGAANAAGRGDSRPRNERRNGGHGGGLCQIDRQVADRGPRRAGLSGQSAVVPLSE